MKQDELQELSLDKNGQYITIDYESGRYYSHDGLLRQMNVLFNNIFKRTYVRIHDLNNYSSPRPLQEESIYFRLKDHLIDIDSSEFILERHDGQRLFMSCSEWGDIKLL